MSTANLSADPAVERSSKSSSPLLFWGGAALAIAMIGVYIAQVAWARMLFTPWYLPIGGTLAALVVLLTLGRPLRWWRVVVALLCVALAGLEWFFLLAPVLPQYSGPIAKGSPLPAFQARLADGTPIDATYFQNGRPSVVVFFQGRWCPFCMTQLRELEEHHGEFQRVGANVVVVSIEDVATAAETQRDFPSLTVVSDEHRELSNAVDLINRGAAPDGGDTATPTSLIIDRDGIVQALDRPARVMARPSAATLAKEVEQLP